MGLSRRVQGRSVSGFAALAAGLSLIAGIGCSRQAGEGSLSESRLIGLVAIGEARDESLAEAPEVVEGGGGNSEAPPAPAAAPTGMACGPEEQKLNVAFHCHAAGRGVHGCDRHHDDDGEGGGTGPTGATGPTGPDGGIGNRVSVDAHFGSDRDDDYEDDDTDEEAPARGRRIQCVFKAKLQGEHGMRGALPVEFSPEQVFRKRRERSCQAPGAGSVIAKVANLPAERGRYHFKGNLEACVPKTYVKSCRSKAGGVLRGVRDYAAAALLARFTEAGHPHVTITGARKGRATVDLAGAPGTAPDEDYCVRGSLLRR